MFSSAKFAVLSSKFIFYDSMNTSKTYNELPRRQLTNKQVELRRI